MPSFHCQTELSVKEIEVSSKVSKGFKIHDWNIQYSYKLKIHQPFHVLYPTSVVEKRNPLNFTGKTQKQKYIPELSPLR